MREFKVGDKVVFSKNVTLNALHANGNNVTLATIILSKKFVTVRAVDSYRTKTILYFKENAEYWLAEWFKPYIGEQMEFDFNA
jgi:hypothetical protein